MRAENGETDSDWSDASDAVSTNAETVTPTCTLNTGDIWCGVLTVEAESTTQDGFGGPTGDLSDKTFRVGGRNYAIEQVTVENSTSPNPGFLNFSLDRVLTAADRARLVLHVDDSSDTFAFSAATIFTFSYTWTGTSLDWSSETFVTLRLRLAPQEPGKPTNLMAEADGGTRIALSWDAPADDGGSAITGYRIEVSDDAGSNWDDLVDDTGNDGTNYTHTGLSPGDTRHYRVSAINAEGASVASDVADATTMREDPAADASLSALDVTRSGGVPVPLHPAFDSDETDYEASVANAVNEVTVAATANVAGATLEYLDGDGTEIADADTNTPGREVALEVGDTVFKVKVTAEDTTTTKTYTVTVTRRAPGAEGEWRLMDVESSAAGGVTARAEVFHAGRWGTVCSDGIRDRDFKVFNYDADGNLFEDTVTDSEGNQVQVLSETEYDNEAAVLICQDRGYDNGEYHGKYKYGPGEVPDHQDADYWPAGSTYSGAATPIWIDDLRCVNGDSALTGTAALPGEMSHCSYAGWGLHNCTHKEDAVVRCWNEEGSIEADASHAVGPLTASFADLPSRHEGTAFTFRIEFSEDVAVSVAEMRDHALTVTGGTVTGAAQVDGRADLWSITVTPSGADEVTISLLPGRDCSETGAVCTADGRQLSTGLGQIVAGPPVVLLTASFEDLPAAHDGETAFTFRVAFSEDIGISYRSLREDAFAVTGGRVTRGRRVDDRRDLFEMTVEPDGGGDVAITLPAGRDCGVSGAICTKGENRRQLTNTPAATVAGPAEESGPAPLTASFVDVPAAHDGETAFTLRMAFSEPLSWMNGRRLREDVVAVAGGRATKAGRVNRRRDLWQLTVEPDSLADVTVTLAAGAACDSPAAVCTKDGRALSNTISTVVRGPVTVSVADARAREGEDASIDFAVSLSRAASEQVTVAYATADGSATAGADYTRTSGTLRFAPGETAKTVRVPVLDDVVDEGEETFTLRLSAASGAVIADGEATGTIVNSDPLSKAWMARFGRSVATHVLDAVGERLQGGASQTWVRLGGYRIGGGAGASEALARLAPRPRLWDEAAEADPVGRYVTLDQLLLGSAFHLASPADDDAFGPRLSAWGQVAASGFGGGEGRLSLNGTVTTTTLGVDGLWKRWLTGVALAYSEGDGSYTQAETGGGDLGSSLTSIHPYVAYPLSDQVRLWGVAGYGDGKFRLGGAHTRVTGLSMTMGAVGIHGTLLEASPQGGLQLALRSDVLWLRMDAAAVEDMVATEADVSRLRLVLEGSRPFALAAGGQLIPSLEVGLRHDGGDAETGSGVEVGARLRYASSWGLSIEASVRGLLAHEAADYTEWGASGALRFDPGRQGRGLTASITPTWGSPASGMFRLWGQPGGGGLAVDNTLAASPAGRLDAELGYGLAALRGRGLLTPYVRAALVEGDSQTWHLGARLALAASLTFSVEASRHQRQGVAAHDLALRALVPW